MYMIMRYPVGVIVEALVLAEGKNRMRVAAAGFPDTIELERSGAQWFTETQQPVEFDFFLCNLQESETVQESEGVSSSKPSEIARAAGDNHRE
jgi:hypothetical protein